MDQLARLRALWVAGVPLAMVAACAEQASNLPWTDVASAPDASAAHAPDADAAVPVGPNLCSGKLPVMRARDVETAELVEPDWSCYEPAAPTGPARPARSLPFRLTFATARAMPSADVAAVLNMFVAGAQVDVFFQPSTLGRPATTLVFDTYESTLDLPAEAISFAISVHGLMRDVPGLSLVEQHQYGIAVPAEASSLQASFTLRDSHAPGANLALAGGQEDPEKANITALVQDCSGRHVHGARLEIIDTETGAVLPIGSEPGALRDSYVQFALPGTDCTCTTGDWPAWFAFNAPVNMQNGVKQHSYRLRVKGRMRTSELEARVFAERELELFAGAITSVISFEHVLP